MDRTESTKPRDNREAKADSSDSPVFIYEGAGDTTHRPAQANIPPRGWYGWKANAKQRPTPGKQ
jgi:hypothetical protein